MKRLFLILLILLPVLTFSAEKPPAIAVMDLEANGISASDVAGLSNRLRSLLFNTQKFTVIERSRMNEILTEQGFQQSGCTNTACAVEIGQLIGVEKIIMGSIDKVADIYSVNLRVVNVGTGQILQNVLEDCDDCRLKDVFKITLPNAVNLVAGLKRTKTQKKPQRDFESLEGDIGEEMVAEPLRQAPPKKPIEARLPKPPTTLPAEDQKKE